MASDVSVYYYKTPIILGRTNIDSIIKTIVNELNREQYSSFVPYAIVRVPVGVLEYFNQNYTEKLVLRIDEAFPYYSLGIKPKLAVRKLPVKPPKKLKYLVSKFLSGDTSGNIAEALFVFVAVTLLSIDQNYIAHLRLDKIRRGGLAPDFLMIPVFNDLTKKYLLLKVFKETTITSPIIVECKGFSSGYVDENRIRHGFGQVIEKLYAPDTFQYGILFLAKRSLAMKRYDVFLIGIKHVKLNPSRNIIKKFKEFSDLVTVLNTVNNEAWLGDYERTLKILKEKKIPKLMDRESRAILAQNIKVMKSHIKKLRSEKYYYFKEDKLDEYRRILEYEKISYTQLLRDIIRLKLVEYYEIFKYINRNYKVEYKLKEQVEPRYFKYSLIKRNDILYESKAVLNIRNGVDEEKFLKLLKELGFTTRQEPSREKLIFTTYMFSDKYHIILSLIFNKCECMIYSYANEKEIVEMLSKIYTAIINSAL